MDEFYKMQDEMLKDAVNVYEMNRLDVRRCLYELLRAYKRNEFPEYFQDEADEIFKRFNLIE